jgi:metallo-beta-lactamase class B
MRTLTLFAPGLLAAASLVAQAPAPAETKPDSPEAKKHVDAAIKAAGTEWAGAEKYICSPSTVRVNKADDPLIEPVKLFDNLYATGRDGTVVYAITTSAGIVLIDAGYGDQVESVLLPQMQKLGLDPAKVTNILVTHGHGDHFGGSAYFQEKYHTKVWMSRADWDLVDRQNQAAKESGKKQAVIPPKEDLIADEGRPLVIGDTKFTIVLVPGHTPGSMAIIFPVKDGGRVRMAGLFGGMFLTPTTPTPEAMHQYVSSVQHYRDVAKMMKVEVEVQNHPIMDGMPDRLTRLAAHKGANPFVVGDASYQRFLTIMEECEEAQIIRRAP